MFVVYTEIFTTYAPADRWYYGTYDYRRANEVAQELGSQFDMETGKMVFHCVCRKEEVQRLGIQNLPDWF